MIGTSSSLALSGEAKAELTGVVKKLADLGIEGAAKYNSADYSGPLQSDLTELLRTSANCKLEVFNELKDKLIPTGSTITTDESRPDPTCSFVSIKALGWTTGHKTNFCIANGYEQGNFNQGEYKNGGICMTGSDPDLCRAKVTNTLPEGASCKMIGNRTECYRI